MMGTTTLWVGVEDDWRMAFDLAYDEGGDKGDLLVSMYVARTDRARKLRNSWKRKLRGVKYFHSKEFKNIDHGVFKGVPMDKRLVMLGELSTLIHRHVSLGITARVNIDFYNSLTTQNFRSRWGTAYTFCINILALGAYLYFRDRGTANDVNIIIEDGHRHSAQAFEIMQDAKKLVGEPGQFLRILSVALGSKQDHPILQAADMLAYADWQDIRNGDREICNAIHAVNDAQHQTRVITIDQWLINNTTTGADSWIQKRKEYGKRTHKPDALERVIQQVRSDDETLDPSSAQQDKSQAGCGESSKGEQAQSDDQGIIKQ